jgi:serine phosphatase RsbU (regulator of sigma subunit)
MELSGEMEVKVSVEWGDTLALYTDGIVESIDADHHWFGTQNLVRVVKKYLDKSPQMIAQQICRAAKTFAVGGLPLDDLTAMVLKFERPALGGEGI